MCSASVVQAVQRAGVRGDAGVSRRRQVGAHVATFRRHRRHAACCAGARARRAGRRSGGATRSQGGCVRASRAGGATRTVCIVAVDATPHRLRALAPGARVGAGCRSVQAAAAGLRSAIRGGDACSARINCVVEAAGKNGAGHEASHPGRDPPTPDKHRVLRAGRRAHGPAASDNEEEAGEEARRFGRVAKRELAAEACRS